MDELELEKFKADLHRGQYRTIKKVIDGQKLTNADWAVVNRIKVKVEQFEGSRPLIDFLKSFIVFYKKRRHGD